MISSGHRFVSATALDFAFDALGFRVVRLFVVVPFRIASAEAV
jgi:hypothetical protein